MTLTATSAHMHDPFSDDAQTATSSNSDLPADMEENSTLILGRSVSLTLATDCLIVLDEAIPISNSSLSTCCGLISPHKLPLRLLRNAHLPIRSIPYYNVLAAELTDYNLTITHASPPSSRSKAVRPAVISYKFEKDQRNRVSTFLNTLLDKAYPNQTIRNKRVKVLVNPFGGKGSAPKWYHREIEPVFRAAGCELSVEHTRYKGHAVDIAEKLDTNAFDAVACCSGDGLPHEVFNGLAKQPHATQALQRTAVVQLPCGTGNAMSWNLNGTDSPSLAALAVVKGVKMPLDLCAITQVVDQVEQRFLSFLSQAVGIVAELDLGTENLRWMGDARFTYGFLTRVFGKTTYPCDIAVDVAVEKPAIRRHCREYNGQRSDRHTPEPEEPLVPTALDPDSTAADLPPDPNDPFSALSSTISTPLDKIPNSRWTPLTSYPTIGNFWAGCMPYMAASLNFFPAALPSDGYIDLVMIDGEIPRLTALKLQLAAENRKLFDFPEVSYRKVRAFRVIPRLGSGYISIDGERVPFGGFQAECLRGAGCTLSRRGGWEADAFE